MDMGSPHSDMTTSRRSLMSCGKQEAVQTDHPRRIGFMPRSNCGPKPAIDPHSKVRGEDPQCRYCSSVCWWF